VVFPSIPASIGVSQIRAVVHRRATTRTEWRRQTTGLAAVGLKQSANSPALHIKASYLHSEMLSTKNPCEVSDISTA